MEATTQDLDEPIPAATAELDSRRELAAARVREYYHATRWDFLFVWSARDLHFGIYRRPWTSHREALKATNRALADAAGVAPGARVVDAGCGTGGLAVQLARERGCKVVGLTLVEAQAELGRRRARRAGVEDAVEFRVADYCDSGLEGGRYDAVLAAESLCHAPDKKAFYREAGRLLRPGGRLAVAEYVRDARSVATADERMSEWLVGWALPDLASEREHRAYAEEGGFEHVALEDWSARMLRSVRRLYWTTRLTFPLARAAASWGVRTRAQHGNVVGSLRCYETLVGGAWTYRLISASRRAPAVSPDAPASCRV